MATKIRLGPKLFFNNNNNSGIVNYIYNIICALKTLPDAEKPSLVVFYSEDAPIDYIKEINYPKINFINFDVHPKNRVFKVLNKAVKKITGKNYFVKYNYLNKIDVLYPYFEFMHSEFKEVAHKVHWLVDFNNRAYPDHYSDGGKSMLDFQTSLTNKEEHIVLSSNSLFEELKQYYPGFKNRVSILRFACTLPDISKLDINLLKEKNKLSKPYFMSPNQFWEHKNQLTLIEALNLLKISGDLNFQVAFTGSMAVNRGKGHILQSLLDKVDQYGLSDDIKFLGLIDRNEQLALMQHSIALIQPSLYEGWSTLVEEAKALNKKIVLSDLPVHREQQCPNSYFFEPLSASHLAARIKEVYNDDNEAVQLRYDENIFQFGKDMLAILKKELE